MEFYIYVIRKMEEKLTELMGKEAYDAFSKEIAKEGFREEVEAMEDTEFKRFITDNFDEITR